ncbi:MAG TPA: hypothetical protein VME44_01850 [Streptosporangiaceae bacterium]|nr:hypothetical protein [Streptosporangiaceae bacterium]HUB39101.1 hypothetical protein [Streptosporangiaceae bacterium]
MDDQVPSRVGDRAAGPGSTLDGHGQAARRRWRRARVMGGAGAGGGQDRAGIARAVEVDDLDVLATSRSMPRFSVVSVPAMATCGPAG